MSAPQPFLIAVPESYSVSEVSSEALAKENVADEDPSLRWQTDDASAIYIVLDLGASVSRNLIYVGYANATPTTSATIQFWSDDTLSNVNGASDPTGAARAESAVYFVPHIDVASVAQRVSRWRHRAAVIYLPDDPIVHRYVRIKIVDSGNADGYFRVGRVVVADAYEAPRSAQYGATPPHVVPFSRDRQLDNANTDSVYQGMLRRASFEYRATPEEFDDDWQGLYERVGTHVPVVFVWYVGSDREALGTIYGRMSGFVDPRYPTYNDILHRVTITERMGTV